MRKVTLFIAVSLITVVSSACLNEYHITRNGLSSVDEFAMEDIYFVRDFNKQKLEEELSGLVKDTLKKDEFLIYHKNNLAVHLIKLGRFEEAKRILEQMYQSHPGEYNVVVNLGTLYELLGQNQRALEYIKKALRINPDSHGGSEWFHIKVLEYKLNKRESHIVPDDNILDLHSSNLKKTNLVNGVAWQFRERIPFTPAPDLMMAKLLMEYGDFLADSLTIKGAYVIYEMARVYDFEKKLPLTERINELNPLFTKYKQKIPRYTDYFVSDKEERERKEKNLKRAKLLDNALDVIFNKENKKKELKTGNPVWPYFTGAGLLAALIFWVRRRKLQGRERPGLKKFAPETGD